MNNDDLLRWYLSNRNMGSLVPSTGRAVGFPANTAVQSGGTAMVPYTGNPVANPGRAMTRSYPQWWEGQFSEVPKELIGGAKGPLAKRLASSLAEVMPRAAGTLAGATGWPMVALAAGDGRPDNSAGDMDALTQAYKEARTNPNNQVSRRFGAMQPPADMTANQYVRDNFPTTPNAQVANRFPQMDPAVLAKGDMLQAPPNQYVAQNFPQQPHVPMPMARPQPQMAAAPAPAQAPVQAPAPQPMGFFQRNAAMMRDPVTGAFIDPTGAAQAQQGGNGNIIQKMLGLLNNKANNA